MNWGSLDQALAARLMDENAALAQPQPASEVMYEAMVLSALDSARKAEDFGLGHDKIILSVKMSGVQDLICGLSQAGRTL